MKSMATMRFEDSRPAYAPIPDKLSGPKEMSPDVIKPVVGRTRASRPKFCILKWPKKPPCARSYR